MNKEEILNELREQFDLTKERLKFKSTYDEINELAYIEDMALSVGYVSNQFSRQMINRMVDSPNSWLSEVYSWIYPQPTDIIHLQEGKNISHEERREMLNMIDEIMYLIRKNKRIAFKGLIEKEEGEFIDELVEFKKNIFQPFMLKYHEKFEHVWDDERKKNPTD